MKFIALMAACAYATTWEQDADLLAGVVFGLFQKEQWNELASCATNANLFANDVLEAFHLIALEDAKNVTAGIKELITTFESLEDYLYSCEQTSDDFVALRAWSKIFSDIASLESTVKYNVTHHLPAITIDIKKAKSDLSKGEYFKAGEVLGTMVAIVTEPLVVAL